MKKRGYPKKPKTFSFCKKPQKRNLIEVTTHFLRNDIQCAPFESLMCWNLIYLSSVFKVKLLAKIYWQGVPSKSNVFNFEMRHTVAGSFCCDRHKLIIIPSGNLSFDLTNWISYIAEAQLLLHIIESVFECCKVWCKQNSSFCCKQSKNQYYIVLYHFKGQHCELFHYFAQSMKDQIFLRIY